MNTAFLSRDQYEVARRRLQAGWTYEQLRAHAAAGTLSTAQRWDWTAIQTIDYLVSEHQGPPPSFSAWLLAQTRRPDLVGHLARQFEDLSTAWVGRSTTEVREHLADVRWFHDGIMDGLDLAEEEFNRLSAPQVPHVPHVLYRFFDAVGVLLYVGLTMDPGTRWKAHSKEKPWWADVATVTVEHHPSRGAVEAAEVAAIRAERPLHNIVHNRRSEVGA